MKRTLLFVLCLPFLQTGLYSAELARDGATGWKIVLPAEPALVEQTAARELAEHLKLVTGADFPTLAEQDAPADGTSLIFVGNTAKAPKKDYKFDEILIKLDGGNLILAGHEKRGCLYAVYSFLQDVVGVRWWTPADTFLPKKPTLTVPDELNVSYAPQMISREMYHRDAQPTVFSARMKGNGFLTPEYGGAVRIINFVHSFYKYLPPEKYFADHPDWYSEIDGKRKHEHAQLCLTNEEMIQELIKNVLETLRKNPGAKMIDVSQNDWRGFCTCEKCKAVDDAEESHAGTLVLMLNKVAEAVEKEFPDVLVESLAYQYTRKPPKTMKPRHNVLIRLCTIECSFIQPLDGEQNVKFAADIEGWSKLAKYLFIWDYTTNYNDYLGPHPNLRVLAPNVRYFIKHGAIGLFAEGEGDDFCELKNWLLLRVMWEPQLDENKLIDEFLRGYYGEEVAPLIKQYWDVLIAQAEKEKIYLGCFGMNSAKWIDLPTLNRVTEIMNKAVETATKVSGPDSDQLRRLRKSKMGIDHVWLSRYYPLRCEAREKKLPFLGPKDPLAAAEEFAQLCKRFKTKAAVISQEGKFDLYLEGLKAGFVAQKNPPEICKGLPEDAWVVFDALSFNNYNNAATIIDDPQGWNGKSVRMGTKVDWNTNYTPPVRGKYRLLASLRCEGTAKEGRLGSWGVYDSRGKKSLKSMTLDVKNFATEDGSFDKKFRWIDLGVIDFVPGAYFWFAHGHRPELDAIFVDRVLLIDAE
ncbi:MAG: DUF4838 domain-containing protein [Candidatus Anammoximicrobium sp.]|nr:DUF4838 domain-containing protein [Candidatus Anammoximicrobium sp.]